MNAPADAESQPAAEVELYCPNCGYNLRGLTSENCPECGLRVDRSGASVSRIPWEHRKRIGRLRAYRRTLVMSNAKLALDVMRPVSYRDARLFQIVTVLIAALPLAALSAVPFSMQGFPPISRAFSTFPVNMPPGYVIDFGLGFMAGAGLYVVVPVAIVLFFLAMTGVPSYFFHPPHLTVEQQNRAVALSYYACAPIVWLVLPAMATAALIILEEVRPNLIQRAFYPMAALIGSLYLVPPLALLATWYRYVRMLRRVTQCSTARVIALAATLPLAWLALAALILAGLPWVAGFLMIVKWSLE